MKLCFYNLYHLGDIFFNKSIINLICRMNPDYTIYMISHYNSHLFSDILNLKHLYFENIDKRYYEICKQDNVNYFIDNDTIFINLWIGVSMFNDISNLTIKDFECNIINQIFLIKNIFHSIFLNHNIPINIDYNISETVSLLPNIPNTDISSFLKWYEINKSHQLIMYFNYTPKSGQLVPFRSHNDIILYIANQNPESYILLPFIPDDFQLLINMMKLDNIINCSILFDCVENKSCENLSKLIKISEYCNYSIHFDIGACFYYMNENIYKSKNIILHIGLNNYYYNNLISNFSKNEKEYMIHYKIKFLLSNDESSIISNISQYISK